MGNCAGVGRNRHPLLKSKWSASTNSVGNFPVEIQAKSAHCQNSAGKGDETFFDSHLCLDSDNEDFFSVNGDTPSCGNTPVGHGSFKESWQSEKPAYGESTPDTAADCFPADAKKRLIELLGGGFNDEHFDDTQPSQGNISQGAESEAYESNDKALDRKRRLVKAKSTESVKCSLPQLAHSLSFSEKERL